MSESTTELPEPSEFAKWFNQWRDDFPDLTTREAMQMGWDAAIDNAGEFAALRARADAAVMALVKVKAHTGRLPNASPELLNGLLGYCNNR